MIIGIVGSEAAKFTIETEAMARLAIQRLIIYHKYNGPVTVCSGHCHLGGVDLYAEEEANRLGVEKLIFPPAQYSWPHYRARNLLIAGNSDKVYCITVKELPPNYNGMRFNGCYHCEKDPGGCKIPHVKSGGCWTALRCINRDWVVI